MKTKRKFYMKLLAGNVLKSKMQVKFSTLLFDYGILEHRHRASPCCHFKYILIILQF
jgi:hypothetical protein